jgi:hypothetical protein
VEAQNSLKLTEEQLERLADRVAIKLAAARPPARPMLTVEDICATFQVSRAWVYENAGRLGGVKLGPGQRAPLRFDTNRVTAALTPLMASPAVVTPTPASKKPPDRKRPTRLHPVYDG